MYLLCKHYFNNNNKNKNNANYLENYYLIKSIDEYFMELFTLYIANLFGVVAKSQQQAS